MGSIAAVSAITDEGQTAATLQALAADSVVCQVAVAAAPQVKLAADAFHRLSCPSLNSPAAVVEALRWFEQSGASHLLWIRSFHPQWKLVYYFRQPVTLPKGTKLLLYSHDGNPAALIESK